MDDNRERELRNVFKFRKISLICLITSILLLTFGGINIVFGIIGAVLMISFFILNSKYWRCPYCGIGFELQHSKMDSSDYCPSCGKKLR
ncbi:hypothetical protein [Oceanirhabdus sp. W0125-5]|uniref:hypothetical protein n=1 Tax=Oceanirhabdus sp. W0125-5 TaxID=2999116 RepID=UPI0022F2B754|nr:hypothetical protein [Oceanirhabdus sp. W0125-5]WBW96489.1 hypothetical protein OW730_22755 [Oceanirhabdus sp. W0125-5]